MTSPEFVDVDGLKLCYEVDGDPAGVPVVLIAGLGAQLINWPDHFIAPLVEAGYCLIRFDNRDVGHSTSFPDGLGDPQAVLETVMSGEEPDVAYTLADMASDTAGLVKALGLESAHIVGVSMGGMIAQALAIAHPETVRSLTSIMSTTGAGDVGQPTDEALVALLTPAPADDRETRIAHGVKVSEIWASPGLMDQEWTRASFEDSWDRAGGPQNDHHARQVCAIIASPPRDELLAMVDAPTLVIHGSLDPLITPSGGERTAACVAGSELLLIDGMAHDLPKEFGPTITSAIIDLVNRAEAHRSPAEQPAAS